MTIHLDNYARRLSKRAGGRQNYAWVVFVNEKADVLETIREVEYELHPTFPVRHHARTREPFALRSSGWGGFMLRATVHFTDDRQEDVHHFVDLRRDWPEEHAGLGLDGSGV